MGIVGVARVAVKGRGGVDVSWVVRRGSNQVGARHSSLHRVAAFCGKFPAVVRRCISRIRQFQGGRRVSGTMARLVGEGRAGNGCCGVRRRGRRCEDRLPSLFHPFAFVGDVVEACSVIP